MPGPGYRLESVVFRWPCFWGYRRTVAPRGVWSEPRLGRHPPGIGKRGREGNLLALKSEPCVGGGQKRAWPRALAGSLLLALAASPSSTESAIANGDTRTITLSNSHTNESGSFTYMVNGYYDQAVLDKLNWFLRDWRLNEPTKMDPKLFDIVWDVYRQSGSREPIDVLSGYRSPQTNAMLRRRSRQVAEHSQHMEGRAMDAHFVDVGTGTIRDIAMREQSGGVGFYPTGSTPWVHIDSGSVRYWPRMSRDALTRLFPDGKTVFVPSDGQPMPGYELARAEIEARGGAVQVANANGGGLFGWLFGGPRGGGADDAEEGGGDTIVSGRGGKITRPGTTATPDPIATASRNLPRGQTFAQAAPADAAPAAAPSFVGRSGQTLIAFAPADSAPARVAFPPPAFATATPPEAAPAQPPAPQVPSLETDTANDASPVSLRGPIAAKFIAPLPPRKPLGMNQTALLEAPMPPPRPQEFAPASDESRSAAAKKDLIAALLQRGKLPGVITQGVSAAPSSALALADPNAAPEPPARPALLDRAAALNAPLPPPRPARDASSGVTAAPRSPPLPPAPAHAAPNVHGANPAAPYGGLVYDAFNVQPKPSAPVFGSELRGSSP
jgi:uncharacterized protein YcbK (DUF882 family)